MIASERVELANGRGLRLSASVRDPGTGRVVVLAHGFASDQRSRGRFPRLAAALAERGLAALSFDFSGCGQSDDDTLSWDKLTDDLRAVITFAAARFARVGLLGHSAGARVCLHACDERIRAMALTGAALDGIRYDWSRELTPAQNEELARHDRVTLPAPDRLSRVVVVERSMLDGFATFEPALLSRLTRPLLIINGDGDDEERALTAGVTAALPRLPAGSRFDIIPGAPHGFGEQYQPVIERLVPWFDDALQP